MMVPMLKIMLNFRAKRTIVPLCNSLSPDVIIKHNETNSSIYAFHFKQLLTVKVSNV